MTAADFDAAIRTLAVRWAFSETSGRRTAARNRDVDGAANSWHLLGLARDIVPDDRGDDEGILADARRLGLRGIQEGDHLHLQPGL